MCGSHVGLQKLVQMDDYISHFRIIHCPLRRAAPRFFCARIVREHADNVQLIKVGELQGLRVFNAATENEMQFCITQKTILGSYPWQLPTPPDRPPLQRVPPC